MVALGLALVPERPVLVVVDDTLARKTGKNIWVANMHHDPLHWLPKALAFGHNWVVVAVGIRVPFVRRPVAVPVLGRLYRCRKRRAGDGANERKTVGAASRPSTARVPNWPRKCCTSWAGALGGGHTMHVLGDSAYGGKSVTRNLPPKAVVITRMSMKAALYDLAPPPQAGDVRAKKASGCSLPRKWPSAKGGWRTATAHIYGKALHVRYQTAVVLWYNSTGSMPVRIVLVRDPKRRRKDDCFFTTDPTMTPQAVIET